MLITSLQDDRSTLVEKVCRQLAQSIRQDLAADTGGLLPPERQLAAQFGVSRPVVREATKRLELQGLLEVRHGVGTRVVDRLHAPLSGSINLLVGDARQRLTQSLEVRAALEPEVARLAAERATPAQRRHLRAVHQRLEEAETLDAAIEADLEFHRALAELSGNDIFALVLSSMADLGRASRQATISFAGVAVARTHHAAILAAVESGDGIAATAAMRHHIQSAMTDLGHAGSPKESSRSE